MDGNLFQTNILQTVGHRVELMMEVANFSASANIFSISENLQQIIGTLTNTDLHLVKEDGRIFVSKQVRLNSGWDA